MGPTPAPDDRARILALAEQGLSMRQISQETNWSRPTVSKILRLEGGHDARRRVPRKVENPAPTLDLEEAYSQADRQAAEAWAKWLENQGLPTYGLPREDPREE